MWPLIRRNVVWLKIGGVTNPETAPLSTFEPARSTDILLGDDSLTDLRLLMDMLMARKVRVSVAFNGNAGYQQAVLQQPQLILLDVQMPVLDGFATCRLLKANPRTLNIPVIFLTAANDLKERLQGFALGGVDYIGKPFNEAEVLARIGVHWQAALPCGPVARVPEPSAPAEGGLQTDSDTVLTLAAQRLLRQSLAHPPTLDQLAALVGTNRRRLNQAFGATCAMPAFEWLRQERLRQAHYLVTHTATPLAMLSDHLGYATPAHFANAFRERFGCPPRDLRSEMQVAQRHRLASEESPTKSGDATV